MDGAAEALNGNPLPQRNQNGPQQQNAAQNNAGNANNMNKNVKNEKNDLKKNAGGGGGGNAGIGNDGGNQRQGNDGGNQRQGNDGGNQRQGNDGGNQRQGNFGNRDGGRGGGGRGGQGNRNFNRGGGGGGGGRNQNRNNSNQKGDRDGGYSQDFLINQKLKQMGGPTHELATVEPEEIKFSGRNRLYIGNLPNDITDDELVELFKPYGEISEAFINKEKNFAFLKVDYHINAEKAKRELDGTMRKNRPIRIRFAPNATTIRVKNLTQYVTNELLYKSFEIFGSIERAVIIVDDRGKSTGEGVVEYARKAGALTATRYCTEKCYFITSSLRPCVVEAFEHIDDTDGYSEKSLNKKNQDFFKARQNGPRFAEIGSFEHEYGTRWKQLHELYKQKHEALKREIQLEEEKLEAQMEYAKYEHETELLREQLRMREQDRDRQKHEWEVKERRAEENRTREEEQMRRQQDEMQIRMSRQEEELRRRQQENTLFMQAQQLNSMLDQQEMNQGNRNKNMNNFDNNDNRRGGGGNANFDVMNQGGGGNAGGMGGNQDNKPGFMDFKQGQNNRQSRFDDQGGQGGNNNNNNGPRGINRQWSDRRDDFQNKRRRF